MQFLLELFLEEMSFVFLLLYITGSISPIAIDEDRASVDQAVQAQEICAALMEAASTSSSCSRSRGGWTSSEDEGDDEMDQGAEGIFRYIYRCLSCSFFHV